ncbi:MAG: transcriptional regulator [Clostridia bacterium]|nr:transcriptional regulator [Clostridia bacterium]
MSIKKKECSTENMTRLTPLMIYKLLRDESSESHPLTTGYILSRLEEQGLKITRQTMYKDIELLKKMEFDIICERKRSNEYYLVQETINVAEQRIIMDAVQSAHFITKKSTDELLHKLAGINGKAQAPALINSTMESTNVKFEDDHIYYFINNIANAISQDCKISFNYFDYNEKKQKNYRKNKYLYVENPVGTVCSGNNYYLMVYNEKYGNLTTYRIDRMDNVNVVDEARNLPEDINDRKKEFLNTQFSMYSGNKVKVIIESSKNLINAIMDMFGGDVNFTLAPDDHVRFRVGVQLSPTFYSWLAGFQGEMIIMSPVAVAKDFCDFLNKNLAKYPPRIAGHYESVIEGSDLQLLSKECKSLSRTRKSLASRKATSAPDSAPSVSGTPKRRGRPPKHREEPVPEAPAPEAPAEPAQPAETDNKE